MKEKRKKAKNTKKAKITKKKERKKKEKIIKKAKITKKKERKKLRIVTEKLNRKKQHLVPQLAVQEHLLPLRKKVTGMVVKEAIVMENMFK